MEQTFAAIDLGSNAIKLKVVQTVGQSFMMLEDLSVPIRVGEEVYLSGMISLGTVNEIVETLKYFKQVLSEYDVKTFEIIATSALREASNTKNVVELIHMKTGLTVEVAEDTIEKFLTYKSIRDQMDNYREIRSGSLLVEVNSGSCDISIYSQNKLIKNEEIKLGIKALKYTLMDLEKRTVSYPNVLKELIETRTSHIWPSIKSRKLKHLVAIGGDAKLIREVLFKNDVVIPMKDFKAMCVRALDCDYKVRALIEDSGANWYEFLATIIVYDVFSDLVEAEHIWIPEISLRDGMIAELVEKNRNLMRYRSFNNDVYTLTKEICKRYRSSESHVKHVEKMALAFWGALKKDYEFNPRDYLLLRLAANLHEIGKYTRMKDYLVTTYDKISNLNILGVTHNEIMMIAHTSRLITSSEYKTYGAELEGIRDEDQIRVYKLASILSMADALDKGKKQRIHVVRVYVKDEAFIIEIAKDEQSVLEEWSFEFTITNFENTFGVRPELREI